MKTKRKNKEVAVDRLVSDSPTNNNYHRSDMESEIFFKNYIKFFLCQFFLSTIKLELVTPLWRSDS